MLDRSHAGLELILGLVIALNIAQMVVRGGAVSALSALCGAFEPTKQPSKLVAAVNRDGVAGIATQPRRCILDDLVEGLSVVFADQAIHVSHT